MQEEELVNVTASCGAGPKGQKTWFKILRGSQGKTGVQLLINVGELNKALENGAYTFIDKKTGDKIMPVNPKVWPAKNDYQDQKVQSSDCSKNQPVSELLDESSWPPF